MTLFRCFIKRSSCFVVPLVFSFAAAQCASNTPKFPECSAPASAWVPTSLALPTTSSVVASTTSSEPNAEPTPTKPTLTIEQLLKVKRSFAARAISKTKFLYLYDQPGTAQMFVGEVGASSDAKPTSKQLTNFPDRVADLRVSPSGQEAVFLKDKGGDENYQIFKIVHDKKPEAITDEPKARHSLPVFDESGKFIAYTSTARNGKDMDLYVRSFTDLNSKPTRIQLSGMFTVSDWKGDSILLTESISNVNQNVWLLNAKTKNKKLLTQHKGDVRYENAQFSYDGKRIYVLTDREREFMSLVAIDRTNGKHTMHYAIDHDLGSLTSPPKFGANIEAWKAKKLLDTNAPGFREPVNFDSFLCTVNENGLEQVIQLKVYQESMTIERKDTNIKGVISLIDWEPEDHQYAFVSLESAVVPNEVVRLNLSNVEHERVTFSDHAEIDESQLVREELLTFKSFDGTPVSFFWYAKSHSADAKLPVVIIVHGGPEAQAQPNFSPVVQYLVSAGYAVAVPNVRGSLGFGKTFAHLDDKQKREDSVRDLSELGKFLSTRSDVDSKRMALYGGSYGGYMVLAGLTLYPEQWAAGVDIVGIANFRTFLEQTAPYRRALREAEYGSLVHDGKFLDQISPIHKVDQIKAPLMIIHGTRDPRVPIGEAKQMYEALKSRGLPVELITFEDEGHGLAKLKNRLVAYPKMVDFLDKYLKTK